MTPHGAPTKMHPTPLVMQDPRGRVGTAQGRAHGPLTSSRMQVKRTQVKSSHRKMMPWRMMIRVLGEVTCQASTTSKPRRGSGPPQL